MQKVYEKVTQQILTLLERGVVPWSHPWKVRKACSYVTKKAYRGLNQLILNTVGRVFGYTSPYWLTAAQAQKLGGSVKPKEDGTIITYWGTVVTDDGKARLFPRYYVVFNYDQTTNVPPVKENPILQLFSPIQKAEWIIAGYTDKPEIITGLRAYYSPSSDKICMPPKTDFVSEEYYYSVLFHEMVHSTGHSSRLDRKSIAELSNGTSYGMEELVAEIGAAFLCGEAEISRTIETSASYIQHWLSVLRGDPSIIVKAASAAQRAADYILGVKKTKTSPEEIPEEEISQN
jgi:antirestriction protein ArdC